MCTHGSGAGLLSEDLGPLKSGESGLFQIVWTVCEGHVLTWSVGTGLGEGDPVAYVCE